MTDEELEAEFSLLCLQYPHYVVLLKLVPIEYQQKIITWFITSYKKNIIIGFGFNIKEHYAVFQPTANHAAFCYNAGESFCYSWEDFLKII